MSLSLATNRELACIMFTDIVSYTRLMGIDEQMALEMLKKNRAIHNKAIKQYGGRWIKELGDGVLITFKSATDAVHCALAIQHAAKDVANMKLRIGIHLSEVVFENDDVFGDGVNIAARIESTATAGGIHISEVVQRNIANKRGINTELLGEGDLKNVDDSIIIYRVTADDEFFGNNQEEEDIFIPLNANKEKAIAIMPFRNLDQDPEQEYFGEGVAEEILITLSNLEGLKVVGRRSSFQFKDSNLPVEEIGKQLNVGVVLEGTVRKHGTGIRVNAELISAVDGTQLWAERYDREMTDLFLVQDEISTKISNRLRVTFDQDLRPAPVNMEAYELLLKGRFYVEKFIEGFDKALACFTRAIELDPNYAEAYQELAELHFIMTMQLFSPPREGFERAKYYAEKALLLKSDLGGAHYVLGQIYFWYNWDFEKAKKQYEMASDRNSTFYFQGVTMDPWYPAFAEGDFDKAIELTMTILERDPLSFHASLHLAYFFTWGGKPQEAMSVAQKLLAVVPNYSEGERLLAYNYLLMGNGEKAIEHGKRAVEFSQGYGWSQITLSIALALVGHGEEGLKLLAELEKSENQVAVSPLGIGLAHAYMGNLDKAFEYMNKALEYRDIWIVSLKHGPEYAPMRQDPRFQKLLDKVGFPD